MALGKIRICEKCGKEVRKGHLFPSTKTVRPCEAVGNFWGQKEVNNDKAG